MATSVKEYKIPELDYIDLPGNTVMANKQELEYKIYNI